MTINGFWPLTSVNLYHKRGTFAGLKFRGIHAQYMDFRGNTFTVEGQGTIYICLYFEQKIHRKNFHNSLKNRKILAQ